MLDPPQLQTQHDPQCQQTGAVTPISESKSEDLGALISALNFGLVGASRPTNRDSLKRIILDQRAWTSWPPHGVNSRNTTKPILCTKRCPVLGQYQFSSVHSVTLLHIRGWFTSKHPPFTDFIFGGLFFIIFHSRYVSILWLRGPGLYWQRGFFWWQSVMDPLEQLQSRPTLHHLHWHVFKCIYFKAAQGKLPFFFSHFISLLLTFTS